MKRISIFVMLMLALAWSPVADPALAQESGEAEAQEQETKEKSQDARAPALPEALELATPEEYKKNLEAQLRAITREREALTALRVEVREDIRTLRALQKKIDGQLEIMDAKQAKKIKKFIGIYSAMSAEEIAIRLPKLNEELRLRVLYGMKPKLQARVLAQMTPAQSADITHKIMRRDF